MKVAANCGLHRDGPEWKAVSDIRLTRVEFILSRQTEQIRQLHNKAQRLLRLYRPRHVVALTLSGNAKNHFRPLAQRDSHRFARIRSCRFSGAEWLDGWSNDVNEDWDSSLD